MVARRKLGLLFAVDENWIGGTYYILNLIHALNTLPDEQKPMLIILSGSSENFNLALKTGYPYLKYRNSFNYKRKWYEKLINTPYRTLFGKDLIDKRITDKDIDILFPASNMDAFGRITHKIYWIPDFQHKHYPEYFSEEEIRNRDAEQEYIAQSNNTLLLSSDNARMDFESHVKLPCCTVKVIPFAVTHPPFDQLSVEALRQEYDIPGNYFMVPNQFWKHKNQLIVLKAIALLKKDGVNCTFVFTGKETDRRNPDYYPLLLDFIKVNHIEEYVRILGLIPRDKQLKLMQEAQAVIQPSLFEGWSTVVEDAKALQKYLIVSDIEIHREQKPQNSIFFNPHDANDLYEKMIHFLNSQPNNKVSDEYSTQIKKFGKQFIELVNP